MTLKSGQLIETQVNDEWQKVMFTHAGRMYSIHNCYDAEDGVPVWCRKL